MNLVELIQEPMGFRFIVQPLTACVVGAKRGVDDAKKGRSAYLVEALTGDTREMIKSTLKTVWKPWTIVSAIDYCVTKYVMEHPDASVPDSIAVGAVLVLPFYAASRGLTNRLMPGYGERRFRPRAVPPFTTSQP